MIELRIEDYCHECPDFEPIAEEHNKVNCTYYDDVEMRTDRHVKCKYAKRCVGIAGYLDAQLKKEYRKTEEMRNRLI